MALESAVSSFLALFSKTLVTFARYGYICGTTGRFMRTTGAPSDPRYPDYNFNFASFIVFFNEPHGFGQFWSKTM